MNQIKTAGDRSSVPVRDATRFDIKAIQVIYARYVSTSLASFDEVTPDVAEMLKRRDLITRAGLPYLVAEVDGEVVGFGYAMPYREHRAYRYTIEDSIYVQPGLKRRGIGSALLHGLIERCEEGPWRQMVAVIGGTTGAETIALHKKFGFEELATLSGVGYKFDAWFDTVLMQRVLGAGASSPPAATS